MRIVIDIPEEDYRRLKEQGMFGRVDVFKQAVKNSIEIPDGCGRLVDADLLRTKWMFSKSEVEEIDAAPTIVEADWRNK